MVYLPVFLCEISGLLTRNNGQRELNALNLQIAAKLKKKSSNNSSAAFGIGVSAMISSIESVTAPVSAVIMVSVSASDVLFPVQDEDEKQTMPTKIASTTNITAFLILQLIHLSGSIKPSNFWQKYNFISI